MVLTNEEGGACTTEFLDDVFPDLSILGTRGKMPGWETMTVLEDTASDLKSLFTKSLGYCHL